jgi:hypothetical protein
MRAFPREKRSSAQGFCSSARLLLMVTGHGPTVKAFGVAFVILPKPAPRRPGRRRGGCTGRAVAAVAAVAAVVPTPGRREQIGRAEGVKIREQLSRQNSPGEGALKVQLNPS